MSLTHEDIAAAYARALAKRAAKKRKPAINPKVDKAGLTDEQARTIWTAVRQHEGGNQQAIAKEYGITPARVSKIWRGLNYGKATEVLRAEWERDKWTVGTEGGGT